MGLIIRSSKIHAAGCYTTTAIKKGQRVLEYTGPRIRSDEADERYRGREVTYLFGIGDGKTVIDGFGMAAFLNHSCDPNCESEEENDRVFLVAIRNIKAEEELVYDYFLYDGDEEDPSECHCGAQNCRGTMYSEAEVQRQTKLNTPASRRIAEIRRMRAPG